MGPSARGSEYGTPSSITSAMDDLVDDIVAHLDDGPDGEGVGVRHAELDHVRAGLTPKHRNSDAVLVKSRDMCI